MTADLLILAVYVIGWVFTYRRAYVALDGWNRKEFPSLGVDAADRAFNAFFAMIAAFVWPLVLAGYLVWRLLTPTTPGEREDRLREREKAAAEREERIRRMEREAGLS